MLDLMSPEKRIPFCGTYPISPLRESIVRFLMSVPPTEMLPSETSKNLGISLTSVDFPAPVLPIMAVV